MVLPSFFSRRRMTRWALAAAVVPWLAGCGANVPEVLKVGVVVAQTGSAGLRGQDLVRGAQMAAEELNASGYKIAGKPVRVEIVPFDDKGEADAAAQGVQKVMDDGAVAVIGPLNTPQAVKAIPVVGAAGKPHFFTATAANLTGLAKGSAYRLLANDDLQARAIASVVHDTVRARRVGVIYENGEYGKGLHRVMSAELEKAGVRPLVAEALDAKAPVTPELAARLKQAEVDTVVLLSREPHLNGLFKGLQEVGHTQVTVVGTNVVRNKNVAAAAIPVKALYATATAIDADEFNGGKNFVAAFVTKHNERPVWGAHYAYDAVHLLADAAARAETVEPKALNAWLVSHEPRSRVVQPMRFSPDGEQIYGAIALYRAERGVWRLQLHSSQW